MLLAKLMLWIGAYFACRTSSPKINVQKPFSLVCAAIFLTIFFEDCVAKKQNYCNPSSCGNIRNISYPFRLKGDPRRCGDRMYELSCENNRTVLYLYSGKYFVNSISYTNYTIRIINTGLQSGNCSSLPNHALSSYSFQRSDPYILPPVNNDLMFLNCPFRVKSPKYLDSSPCVNHTNSSDMYSYVLLEDSSYVIPDVKDSCFISLTTVGCNLTQQKNISFLDIHQNLLRGIELKWYNIYCRKCLARGSVCHVDIDSRVICYAYHCLGRLTIYCIWMLYNEDILPWVWKILKIIGFFLAGRTLCGILCLLVLVVYKYRRRHLSLDYGIEEFLQGQTNFLPIRYSYWDIKRMTNGFKEKLGQGGFGSVYKGKLRSGRLVAVKMLGNSKTNGQDFMNEVATIGRIHHVNVVQLTGYCVDDSKRALIYDFMPNGSLEKYIFPRNDNLTRLSWAKLHDIALGVSHGIEYLHEGCVMQILHFDIKPHNILLDHNFIPKVSDFGLAKLYSPDDSIVSLTAARGTIGYIAPELFYKNIGGVSFKADVYSFGMLLMEMAGRRKNLNTQAENSSQVYFPMCVYEQLNHGEHMDIGDATDEEREIAKKFAMVSLWCIQMKPSDRPSMNKVVEMLESAIETLQLPPKLCLVPEDRMVVFSAGSSNFSQSEILSQSNSIELISLN